MGGTGVVRIGSVRHLQSHRKGAAIGNIPTVITFTAPADTNAMSALLRAIESVVTTESEQIRRKARKQRKEEQWLER